MTRIRMVGIASVLALASTRLHAREPVNVAVEFNAAPGCSERDTFASSLKARSSRIQIVEPGPRVWGVSVRVTSKERGVHGELRLTDENGESELRAVDGADCAEVVEALSLTAALAIEQIAEAGFSDPQHAGSATTVTTPSRVPNCVSSSSAANGAVAPSGAPNQTEAGAATALPNQRVDDSSNAADTLPHHLLLHGFMTERITPQISLGTALEFGRQFDVYGAFSPELSLGAVYIPGDVLQSQTDLRVNYWAMGIMGCPLKWTSGTVLTVRPCVLYELGSLNVSARRLDVSSPSERLTSTLGVVARGQLRLARHISLELRLGLMRSLSERRYLAQSNDVQLGETAPLAWQMGIGWLVDW